MTVSVYKEENHVNPYRVVLRGTLAEILAATPGNGVVGEPSDAAACLKYSAVNGWQGSYVDPSTQETKFLSPITAPSINGATVDEDGNIQFPGTVVADSFQATDGAQDFFPSYAAGVPAVASLQILANQSQRVALPSGCTAYRLTFRGYGPFAYRLGSSDVVAVATDAPGLIDPTIVVPAVPGATHIAVYGVDGGVGSLVVEGGSALPKTGFIPAYSGGVPKVVTIPFNAGETGAAVALPTDCTALRITTRNYGPAAYRLGGASVAAVATDAPADVLSPAVIPILPGATHISVYGLGTGIMVLEGGNKA